MHFCRKSSGSYSSLVYSIGKNEKTADENKNKNKNKNGGADNLGSWNVGSHSFAACGPEAGNLTNHQRGICKGQNRMLGVFQLVVYFWV